MDTVTGSFGYIGKYITRRLIDIGRQVQTITTNPNKPNSFGQNVRSFPYQFDNPKKLIQTLTGVETLYNTYWIRFAYDGQSYEDALENTRILFQCAKDAGVRRIVQISVTHASTSSDLPYYRGKGRQEEMLAESGVPFSIIRPTLVFGDEDILVNNIAWFMRNFPIFPVFGDGNYRIQPVFVEDLAQTAVTLAGAPSGTILDAIGREIFAYKDFLHLIRNTLERNILLVPVPPSIGIFLGKIIGTFLGDVVLTKNEMWGLMEENLVSSQVPNGETLFSEWLKTHRDTVGKKYSSEIGRHFHWKPGN